MTLRHIPPVALFVALIIIAPIITWVGHGVATTGRAIARPFHRNPTPAKPWRRK